MKIDDIEVGTISVPSGKVLLKPMKETGYYEIITPSRDTPVRLLKSDELAFVTDYNSLTQIMIDGEKYNIAPASAIGLYLMKKRY